MEILHTGFSRVREREGEEKSKSRDLSNRSLKTDGGRQSRDPTKESLKRERERKRRKELEQRSK